ncbi:MAG: hypothetical protein ABL902_00700 [Gallionella sp.]|nr:hypothetical protein [Gallionella sp.]
MKNILLVLFTALISTPVYADRGGHRHGSEFRGSMSWEGSGWFFPALVGGAIFLDLARRTAPAEPETVYVQPEPVYAPKVAAAPVWYFCPATNTYYPYVNSCPGGWQTVPATPPAATALSKPANSPSE